MPQAGQSNALNLVMDEHDRKIHIIYVQKKRKRDRNLFIPYSM